MRKTVMGALLVAGALVLMPVAGVPAEAARDSSAEIRVFVLDKSGSPVDVKNWTGAVDVMPLRGQRKAFKFDPVSSKGEGHKEGVKEGAKDPKDPMLCGQVKELDDWYVEMVVLRPGMPREEEGKAWDKGFSHTHGGSCFKVTVDEAAIKDSKTGVLNFKSTVVFTLPNGDTKYVKGFAYPEGVIEDVLGRILDKDLKETSKMDHEQAAMTGRKIQKVLHSLPPLSFKSAEDRQEFEKAKQECMAACHRLEQATGKEIGDAADKCKSSLKDVRSQAKDAEGALTAE
jgi:proteasome lid subunit RPN8/RPN11